jgi:hypothetical protein
VLRISNELFIIRLRKHFSLYLFTFEVRTRGSGVKLKSDSIKFKSAIGRSSADRNLAYSERTQLNESEAPAPAPPNCRISAIIHHRSVDAERRLAKVFLGLLSKVAAGTKTKAINTKCAATPRG